MQTFLSGFFRDPRRVGSAIPSSRALARALVDGLDLAHARVVVEVGPGTGAVTEELLRRVAPGTRVILVELHPPFVEHLREKYPEVEILHADASDLPGLARQHGFAGCDAVLSGLPLANFPKETTDAILGGISAILAPGGRFTMFNYLGTTYSAVRRVFAATRVRYVLWNIPPAFVYASIKQDR